MSVGSSVCLSFRSSISHSDHPLICRLVRQSVTLSLLANPGKKLVNSSGNTFAWKLFRSEAISVGQSVHQFICQSICCPSVSPSVRLQGSWPILVENEANSSENQNYWMKTLQVNHLPSPSLPSTIVTIYCLSYCAVFKYWVSQKNVPLSHKMFHLTKKEPLKKLDTAQQDKQISRTFLWDPGTFLWDTWY